MELKITDDRVREAATLWPEAKAMLKTLFPEAFPLQMKEGDLIRNKYDYRYYLLLERRPTHSFMYFCFTENKVFDACCFDPKNYEIIPRQDFLK